MIYLSLNHYSILCRRRFGIFEPEQERDKIIYPVQSKISNWNSKEVISWDPTLTNTCLLLSGIAAVVLMIISPLAEFVVAPSTIWSVYMPLITYEVI